MGWLSLFKRKSEDDVKATSSARDGPGDPAVSAQAARTGARHRLLGAVILLAVGVIGFPLVFETQPRPIAIDIPIEIPRKDAQLPLEMPLPKPAAVEVTAAEPAAVPSAPAPVQALPDNSATQGRDKPAASAPPPTAAPDAGPAAGKPAPERPAALASAAGVSVVAKSAASAPAPAKPPAVQSESARAKAFLEGGATSASAPAKSLGRFVVQVGAFADASAAREVRLKVEKLGFKTYTQITETTSGKRIRVRVGPLATREEADVALGRLKASGLAAVVLTL